MIKKGVQKCWIVLLVTDGKKQTIIMMYIKRDNVQTETNVNIKIWIVLFGILNKIENLKKQNLTIVKFLYLNFRRFYLKLLIN